MLTLSSGVSVGARVYSVAGVRRQRHSGRKHDGDCNRDGVRRWLGADLTVQAECENQIEHQRDAHDEPQNEAGRGVCLYDDAASWVYGARVTCRETCD